MCPYQATTFPTAYLWLLHNSAPQNGTASSLILAVSLQRRNEVLVMHVLQLMMHVSLVTKWKLHARLWHWNENE